MKNETIKIGLALVLALWMVGESKGQMLGFEWAKHAGGIGQDGGDNIVVNSIGESYVIGLVGDNGFFDSIPFNGNGGYTTFLAKYDASGSVLWAKPLPDIEASEIVLDASENLLVGGIMGSSATIDTITITGTGNKNAVIVKFSPTGQAIWAKPAAAYLTNNLVYIALDSMNNIYLSGEFKNTISFDTISFTSIGYSNLYIAKFDVAGNFIWANQIVGTNAECKSLVVDKAGNSFISGDFNNSISFGPNYYLSDQGSGDSFHTKYNTSGNVSWVKHIGYNRIDYTYSAHLDEHGNSYLTGIFNDSTKIDTYTLYATSDMYVVKYNSQGQVFWISQGGSAFVAPQPRSIDVVASGGIYISGTFGSTVMFGSHSLTSFGNSSDVFVTKLDSSGNFLWAGKAGGYKEDIGFSVTHDNAGKIYLTGFYGLFSSGIGGPGFFGSITLPTYGKNDIFIAKLGNDPLTTPSTLTTSSFTLSPNPARSQVRLTQLRQPVSCTLYNLLGQPVRTQPLPVSATEATLPLHGLAPGLYTLQVQTASGVRSEKLLLE